MTLKKSQRLNVVLELAERDELEATQAVQAVRARLSEEEQRLEDLRLYYREYEQRFEGRREGIRASEIAGQRQLLVELTHMQSRQSQQIEAVQKALNQKLEVWRSCHLKYQSLEKLIGRIKKEEDLALDKKEQKILDEWFNRVQQHSKG